MADNSGKTVREILKGKQGGIKTAPLDPGSPSWDEILDLSWEEIVDRAKRQGRCVLLSTHIMEEAEKLCDRVAIVAQGRVRAEGTLDELRARTGLDLEEIFVQLVAQTVA